MTTIRMPKTHGSRIRSIQLNSLPMGMDASPNRTSNVGGRSPRCSIGPLGPGESFGSPLPPDGVEGSPELITRDDRDDDDDELLHAHEPSANPNVRLAPAPDSGVGEGARLPPGPFTGGVTCIASAPLPGCPGDVLVPRLLPTRPWAELHRTTSGAPCVWTRVQSERRTRKRAHCVCIPGVLQPATLGNSADNGGGFHAQTRGTPKRGNRAGS